MRSAPLSPEPKGTRIRIASPRSQRISIRAYQVWRRTSVESRGRGRGRGRGSGPALFLHSCIGQHFVPIDDLGSPVVMVVRMCSVHWRPRTRASGSARRHRTRRRPARTRGRCVRGGVLGPATMSRLSCQPLDRRRLAELQRVWGVSIDLLLYRCCEVGLLADPAAGRAWRRLAELRNEA